MPRYSRQIRNAQILDFFSEEHTIQELCDRFGFVYNTGWRYVTDLCNNGELIRTAHLRKGSELFISGTSKAIPEIWNSYSSTYLSFFDLVKEFNRESNQTLSSEQVVHDLFHNAALMAYAIQMRDLELLQTIQARMRQGLKLLDSTAGILRQLCDNARFYRIENIEKMTQDPHWVEALVMEAYAKAQLNRDVPEVYIEEAVRTKAQPPVGNSVPEASDAELTRLDQRLN